MDESKLLGIYHQLIPYKLSSRGGMLSVDKIAFIKKGTHFVGVKGSIAEVFEKQKTVRMVFFFLMLEITGTDTRL